MLGNDRAVPLLSSIAQNNRIAEVLMAVRQVLAQIERKKADPLRDVLAGKDDWELVQLAQAKDTPPEVLDQLADDPSHSVRALVAQNPAAPLDTLRQLVQQLNVSDALPSQTNVHLSLPMNPQCPADVLLFIEASNLSRYFVDAMKKHPNYPK
jgi:hypothetical protein